MASCSLLAIGIVPVQRNIDKVAGNDGKSKPT